MADQTISVKHINNKTAGVNPRDSVTKKAPIFMGRVFGVIQGVKMFEDKRSGDLKTVFQGDFRMQGPDGKLYESEKMFAFKALEEKFSNQYKGSGEKPQEFAYDISAVPDDKSATGYAYQAKSVIPTVTSDRLAALAKTLTEHAIPSNGDAPATEEKGGKKK